jgi:hypothetical protein
VVFLLQRFCPYKRLLTYHRIILWDTSHRHGSRGRKHCKKSLKLTVKILNWKKSLKLTVNFTWENHHCEKHGTTQLSPNPSRKLWKRLAPGMPGRSYQTKPGLPSGCQVNIKYFYAKSTCLIIETSAVWPWCRRSFLGNCRGLWIIIAELTCGLFPMIFCMVFPSWM